MKDKEEKKGKKKHHHSTSAKVIEAFKQLAPHHHSHHEAVPTPEPTSTSSTSKKESTHKHRHKHHEHRKHAPEAVPSSKPVVPSVEAEILRLNEAEPTRAPEVTRSPTTPELLSAISPEAVIIAPPPPAAKELPPAAKTWLQRLDLFLANFVPNYAHWRRLFTNHVVTPHDEACQQAVDALSAVLNAIQRKTPAVNEALSSAGRILRFTGQSSSTPTASITQVVEDPPRPPSTPALK